MKKDEIMDEIFDKRVLDEGTEYASIQMIFNPEKLAEFLAKHIN